MPDLRPLLSPDSVAIIGAAADDSLRGRLTHQLIEHGFDGRIYPVTRSQSEVLGHKAYASVGEIPEAADLAVILVPAAHVVSTIEQCAAPSRSGPASRPCWKRMTMSIGCWKPAAPTSSCAISKASVTPSGSAPSPTRQPVPASR